jgi:hypothetical protein
LASDVISAKGKPADASVGAFTLLDVGDVDLTADALLPSVEVAAKRIYWVLETEVAPESLIVSLPVKDFTFTSQARTIV